MTTTTIEPIALPLMHACMYRGKFSWGSISRIVDLYHFMGLIFMDAYTHAHYVLHDRAFFLLGLYFTVRQSSGKTAKIGLLEHYTVDSSQEQIPHLSVQCNLDYPNLIYPDPRLSRLAGDQKIHYHACAEGVASDLLWVWSQIE